MVTLRAACAALLLAWTAAAAPAHAVASAELYRVQPEYLGRFEARIRYAAGDGVISSFFLWKEGSEIAGTYWNELDFEKLEGDCHMQTNTLYGNPLMSGEQQHTMPSDMCDTYHDYRFDWTPDSIAWFIDGREIRRVTGAVARAFADNAAGGMTIHFNVWPGTPEFGGNFDPKILPVRQYISWVQYSSYNAGNFELKWREEFNGSRLPSGWATGTWESPLNRSKHADANVTFVNGIAVLSLTSDANLGFNGVPPADSAAPPNGGAGAGGSSGGAPAAAGQGALNGGNGGSGMGGKAGQSSLSGGEAGGGAAGQAGQAGSSSGEAGGTPNAAGGTSALPPTMSTGGTGTGTAPEPSGGTSGTGVPQPIAGSDGGLAPTPAGASGWTSASGNGAGPEPGGCGCRAVTSRAGSLSGVSAVFLGALAAFRRRRGSFNSGTCRAR